MNWIQEDLGGRFTIHPDMMPGRAREAFDKLAGPIEELLMQCLEGGMLLFVFQEEWRNAPSIHQGGGCSKCGANPVTSDCAYGRCLDWPMAVEEPPKVVDLMAALEKSLADAKATRVKS